MGVSISITGSGGSPRSASTLDWVSDRAAELEWSSRRVALAFPRARLRSGRETTWLETPRAAGISLLPHFACERLPLVFLDTDGRLVDEVIEHHGTDEPTLLAGVIVKTQFAGPEVHREICEVLREVARRMPGIVVDDESGYAASGDERALARAFSDGWSGIRTKLAADRPRVGARVDIGGFPVEVRGEPSGSEFSSVTEEQRGWLLAGERAFVGRFGGFGTTLDRSRASVVDLELAISDADVPEFPKDPSSPELVELATSAGAYFGRTLIGVLGGSWTSEGGQLVVSDVGGSGLIVDPFDVARDRIVHGPPYSFAHHLEVYETFARHLGRDRQP